MLHHAYHCLRNISMAGKPLKDSLLVILGATGTGKSQLAVELATRFNGEIINGDAMQMYDGLPIITNKMTVDEQKGIPHHLLGFVALDKEPWRVGMFKRKASQIIQEIRSRGRLPIVVGGTHYYTQSMLFEDSLVTEPVDAADQAGREFANEGISLRFPILDGPTEEMVERLRAVDPIMADRWHPKDRRKIRRSLEIFLTTGKKASDLYEEQKINKMTSQATEILSDDVSHSESVFNLGSTLLFWVHSDSEILKARLDDRVTKMVEAGLLDEVKSMDTFLDKQKKAGITVDKSRGIWVSIGWKEFELYLAALKSGSTTPRELDALLNISVEQTKAATRQYAKRQVRWIRLKLIPALSNANVLDKLYLLDGSDVATWRDAVSSPAIGLTEKFLAGDELCAPSELSDVARQFLAPEEEFHWIRQECKVCNVIAVTEKSWQQHLRSRGHRYLTRKNQDSTIRGGCLNQK